jgi:hypothetical protein
MEDGCAANGQIVHAINNCIYYGSYFAAKRHMERFKASFKNYVIRRSASSFQLHAVGYTPSPHNMHNE